jgi:hypothetical protein
MSQVPVLRAGLECTVHGICHCVNGPGVDTDGARQARRTPHKLCGGVCVCGGGDGDNTKQQQQQYVRQCQQRVDTNTDATDPVTSVDMLQGHLHK